MQVVTRKKRITAVDLRARVPVIARGLALFLLIAGTVFVGISYYKMRNNQPFRMSPGAPALSKDRDVLAAKSSARVPARAAE